MADATADEGLRAEWRDFFEAVEWWNTRRGGLAQLEHRIPLVAFNRWWTLGTPPVSLAVWPDGTADLFVLSVGDPFVWPNRRPARVSWGLAPEEFASVSDIAARLLTQSPPMGSHRELGTSYDCAVTTKIWVAGGGSTPPLVLVYHSDLPDNGTEMDMLRAIERLIRVWTKN